MATLTMNPPQFRRRCSFVESTAVRSPKCLQLLIKAASSRSLDPSVFSTDMCSFGKPSLKRKRSVCFRESADVLVYEGMDQELYDCWYNALDERGFKRQAKAEIIAFRLKKTTKEMCPVGLEQQLISGEYTKHRALTKKMVKLSVLHEQSQFYDDERSKRIADAAGLYSNWCVSQAETVGILQARAAL